MRALEMLPSTASSSAEQRKRDEQSWKVGGGLVRTRHQDQRSQKSDESEARTPLRAEPLYVALTTLREQPNISQQAFCEAVHLDPNNCVLLLNSLEADSLVERRRDPGDRRGHILILTPKGNRALEHADRALESVEDEVLGGLSHDERATLHRLLQAAMQGAPAEAVA